MFNQLNEDSILF